MRRENNFPNLFIVGAAKSGTTALVDYLNQHPEIYFSPIKEPHYFSKDIRYENFREDHKRNTNINLENYFKQKPLQKRHIAFISKKDDYLSLFAGADKEIILGEASTGYLFSKVAAKEIYDFNPNSKIIIILRNPVERTISHYFMDAKNANPINTIYKDLLNDYSSVQKGYCISNLYIELSLYFEQIKRYLEIFPANQILILRQETLNSFSQDVINTICKFLEISKLKKLPIKTINQSIIPRNRSIEALSKLKRWIPVNKKILNITKQFLYKKPEKKQVDQQTIKFINDKVGEDWIKTQKLIREWKELSKL